MVTRGRHLPFLLALLLISVFGVIFASNMMFQNTVTLTPPGPPPEDGTNDISLPYDSPLTNIDELGTSIGGFACRNFANPVVNIQVYNKTAGGLGAYDGCAGSNLPILPGQGYRIKVKQQVEYTIVGSHDPGRVLTVTGPGAGFEDGTNFIAWPPHAKANTARKLGIEAGGFVCASPSNTVVNVQVYQKSSGGLFAYDGCSGATFLLKPGDGYRIKMNTQVNFTPSHY